MSLRALQQRFQAGVLQQTADAAGDLVTNAYEGFSIYAQAYVARLHEALCTTYPRTREIVGEQAFASVCEQFALQAPSTFPSIRDYGAQLPRFLEARTHPDRAAGIRELAEWEWRVAEVFDAAEEAVTPLELACIAPSEWATLILPCTSTARRMTLYTQAVACWRDSPLATQPAEPARSMQLSDASQRTQWVLWRRDLQVQYRSLAEDEAQALDLALNRRPFADLCAALSEWHLEAEVATRAATLLRDWIAIGLVRAR